MLRIVNVSESDAGDYRCTAINQLGSVHHTIHVTVKGVCVCAMKLGALRPIISLFLLSFHSPSSFFSSLMNVQMTVFSN